MKPLKNPIFKTLSAALFACILFSHCGKYSDTGRNLPSEWLFLDKNTPLYIGNWIGGDHSIGAMNGSYARFEAVRASGNEDIPFTYTEYDSAPFAGTLVKDDYLLFRVPVEFLEQGSHIEIDAVVISNPSSPKYFLIEYYESGRWKSVSEDLLPVPEDPQLKYSFLCTGLSTGEPHEYTSIYQTITLGKAIRNGELKIRFRAVGDYTCSQKEQDIMAEDGSVGLANFGYTAAHIADFGTEVPTDTTEILCIGNSFTYFSNAPSMMKEIAWSQGHYFDINASLKGGQTLGQHVTRVMTKHLAEVGGYDYAIFQDQSQNPARHASDPARYADVAEGYKSLSSMVLANSPDCQVIMEQTWAYPAFDFGGFDDFRTFTRLLEEGASMMASQNGGIVSPIGNAYEIIWNENKDLIRLYDSDAKHQSHYGSYLKACVNYLMITGEPFSGIPADCGLEPSKPAILRDAAERAVFRK